MNKQIIDKLQRLDSLQMDTKQQWGKMSPQHMVEHLVLTVRISNGKLLVKCFNPEEKLPVLKRFLMSSKPLPREFINPLVGEGLLPLEFDNLESAKKALVKEVEDYYKYFEDYPEAVLVNPTFGPLNKAEWEIFHEKHFNHHLSQFGILE